MPSVGFLFALPFIFSFTHVREEKKFLVNLFAFALVPEVNPGVLPGEIQQDGDTHITRGTERHLLPWLHTC